MTGCFIVYAFFVTLFFLSAPKYKEKDIFWSMSAFLWDTAEEKGKNGKNRHITVERYLEMLYKPKETYHISKIRMVLLVLFVGNTLAFLSEIQNSGIGKEHQAFTLQREAAGGQKIEENLQVEISDKLKKQPFSVEVEPKQYTEKEIQSMFRKAEKQLPETVLGKKQKADGARGNLNLVESLFQGGVKIDWELDNYEYMDLHGARSGKKVPKEGVLLGLTAGLTCQEEKAEVQFFVKLLPEKKSKKEQWEQYLAEEIKKKSEDSKYKSRLELPVSVRGKEIKWSKNDSFSAGALLFAVILIGALVYYEKDQELKKEVEKREKQMLLDYPEMLSKLLLLLGAGMTIRRAWERISGDYEKKKKGEPGLYRYAYEEMIMTVHELETGVSEAKAYDRFGNRCQVREYLRFSAFIVQNLKKGTDDLLMQLGLEVEDAFEKRKNIARRLGEEAGTKLLLPMVLMLLVVLLIVMIPAFLSFQV